MTYQETSRSRLIDDAQHTSRFVTLGVALTSDDTSVPEMGDSLNDSGLAIVRTPICVHRVFLPEDDPGRIKIRCEWGALKEYT